MTGRKKSEPDIGHKQSRKKKKRWLHYGTLNTELLLAFFRDEEQPARLATFFPVFTTQIDKRLIETLLS